MLPRVAALLGCVLIGNGCATVTGSETQVVSVETLEATRSPVGGADCKLTNDQGYWNVRSPGVVTVRKSAEDLLVHCVLDSQPPGSTRAMSRANAGMIGNVLIGGLIGAAIDHSSGKAYDYPRVIQVVLGAHRVMRDEDMDRIPVAPAAPAPPPMAPLSTAVAVTGTYAPAHPGLPRVGSAWKYSIADQRFGAAQQLFTIRVTAVDGWEVRESLEAGSGAASSVAVNAREVELFARRVHGGTILEMGPYFYAMDLAKTMNAPRRPRDYPLGNGGWHIEAPRVSEDTASVPAGRFKALRIDVAGSSLSSPLGQPVRFQYSAWYAPEAKRYVMLRHQAWNRQGGLVGDEVVKLVEYKAD